MHLFLIKHKSFTLYLHAIQLIVYIISVQYYFLILLELN